MEDLMVAYARVVEDPDMGILMTGIYLAGIRTTREDADALCKECVSNPSEKSQSTIIPKIIPMRGRNLREVMKICMGIFDKVAIELYDQEEISERDKSK